MSMLEVLTPQERQLVASLPYRAGLWVSVSDTEGGDKAEEKELIALNNIILGFAEQVFGSEFLQYVMRETVAQKDNWALWSKDIDTLPDQCRKALIILRSHFDEKEVQTYTMRLIEIGEAVALAFRESQPESPIEKLKTYVAYNISKYKATQKKQPAKTYDQYLSISPSERKAMMALAGALGLQYSV